MSDRIGVEPTAGAQRTDAWVRFGAGALVGLAAVVAVWSIVAERTVVERSSGVLVAAALAAAGVGLYRMERAIRSARFEEQARLQRHETLEAVVESLAEGVAVADSRGRLTLFNPEAEQLLGLGRTDTGPQSWSKTYGLFHPDGETLWPGEELPLARAVRGETTDEVEMFVRNPQRSRGLFIRVKATPIRDRAGRVHGGVAIFRDVTESKRAVAAARESETRFNQLVQSIPQVFWIADRSLRRVEYVSPPYQSVFGRPIGALLSNPLDWVRVVHHADRRRVLEAIRELRTNRVELECRIVRPDGELRRIRIAGFPVRDSTDRTTRVTGIAEDVTERRAAEDSRRLRSFAGHLQDARERERIRVAREIHDELGQALTALKLELAVLARRVGSAEERERAEHLADRVDGIAGSVRRISESLRPDVLDKLGLHEAVRWLADDFERRTGVRCRLTLPEGGFEIDSRRATALFRILQESLTNVARHARAEQVTIVLETVAEEFRLEVTDDGQGISDDALTTSGSFGLIGMHERARTFGGRVRIDAAGRRGTRIRVRLPSAL